MSDWRPAWQPVITESLWRLAVWALAIVLLAPLAAGNPSFPRQALISIGRGRISATSSFYQSLAILGVFWVFLGAALRAVTSPRRLTMLVILRALALLAGSAAVVLCLQMVTAIARNSWPLQFSMAFVSAFSLAIYACWRWVSLLLAVVECSGDWRRGWHIFANSGLTLAVLAATNSTLKWFVLALTGMPAIWLLQQRLWMGSLAWLAAPIAISGYFAVKLKESIQELT